MQSRLCDALGSILQPNLNRCMRAGNFSRCRMPGSKRQSPSLHPFDIGLRHISADAHHKVNFGKHRGLTYAQVLTGHWDYCKWLSTLDSARLDVQLFQRYIRRHQLFASVVPGGGGLVDLLGHKKIDFGRCRDLTYTQAFECHPSYCQWVLLTTQNNWQMRHFRMYIQTRISQQRTSCPPKRDPKSFDIVRLPVDCARLRKSGRSVDPRLVMQAAAASVDAIHTFDGTQLSMLTCAFATIDPHNRPLWNLFAEVAESHIQASNGQHLANFAWAFAYAGRTDSKLFDAIARAVLRTIHYLRSKELGTTAWAFAKAGRHDAKLFDAVAEASVPIMHNFDAKALANLAWAFSKVGRSDASLFESVAAAASSRIEEFVPQGLANLVWAFSKIGRDDAMLFDKVAEAASGLISRFNPTDLANIACSFAKIGRNDSQLFGTVAAAAVSIRLSDFESKDLAGIVYAFAKVSKDEPHLFEAVAEAALSKINKFNAQGLANLAWSFAKIGRIHSELFDAVALAAPLRINDFIPIGCSTIVWAFARFGRTDPKLFHAMAGAALILIDKFSAQDLAKHAWAFAKIGRSTEILCDSLAEAALLKMQDFSRQELGMMSWAFVEADLVPTPVTRSLLAAIIAQVRSRNWNGLAVDSGPQPFGTVEARCATLVLGLIPGALRNRYHQMNFELDIVIKADDGTLVDLEIDELYRRTQRQRGIDSRRDWFFKELGIHVVRFDPFDEVGWERGDLAEALQALLRSEGLLGRS
ncbi:unnamed protein product [Polarella glacialis]|uniref:RNA-editing substrate-binding complex 6 protein domain-containing protein n=1 Tax=Polarella glacialis TaxID=89957 RepID=A0A813DCW5_POLGL|nr:unnamed protein product [Polarella glacialis]